MFRLNLLLLGLLVVSAVALVRVRHDIRRYYGALEQEKRQTQALEAEYGRLRLEQSTWLASAKVEDVAIHRLRMRKPGRSEIEVMALPKVPEKEDAP